MKPETELTKFFIALCWMPFAVIVYVLAFGAGMLKLAAKYGWEEFT